MRPAEEIKRLIENAKIKINQDVKKAALSELVNELEQIKNMNQAKTKPDIWRIIMNKKIIKFATAAVILAVIIIGINQFGDGNAAFADVIGYLQKNSYTFELQGLTQKPIQAMVWELGRIRIDYPPAVDVGDYSSITDFNTGQTLLLFHQDKTAVLKKEPAFKSVGTEEIISVCTRPITELWNVLDGAEKYIGEKVINGQHVFGFEVIKEDQNFKYDITIWADYESGLPSIVEVKSKPLDESYPIIECTMENFDLDVILNEELFSMELPSEYTFAYEENLENIEEENTLSSEAEKILLMLELAKEDRKEDATELLLNINWAEQIEFGNEPYVFSISEKQYKALSAEDQNLVLEENSTYMTTIRDISQEVLDMGKTAVSTKRYEDAEKYFIATLELGKLLGENYNTMIVPHLVGLNIEKKVLNEMIELYKITNNNEKLQDSQNQLNTAQAEIDRIRQESAQMN